MSKRLDLVGQTFSRLSVLKFSHINKGCSYWLCLCICGNTCIVSGSKLRFGHIKSCGCIKKEKLKNLVGQVFGLWTVISFSHFAKTGGRQRPYWNCRCDCGNEGVVRGDILKNGGSKSCGCYRKDRSLIPLPEYSYEEAYKRAKSIYKHMKQRCSNINETSFNNYGARGIKICNRWLQSFENFYEDMGPAPSNKHSIDRINNDGNYEPSNCRWATVAENNRNKRTTHFITYKNKTQCVTDWSNELGISSYALFARLRNGWTEEEALTIPVGGRRKKCQS